MSSQQPHDPLDTTRPSHADCAAIDALIDAGLNPARVPEALRPRATRVHHLLESLACGNVAPGRDGLIRTTIERILAEAAAADRAGTGGWIHDDSGLSAVEQDSLEALLVAGYDPARVPASLRATATEQASLLALLATPLPDEATPAWSRRREDLVARTLEAVQGDLAGERERMTVGSGSRWSGLRRWDLAGLAAALVLGGSLAMPMLGSMRDSIRQTACLGNFQAAGLGLAQYGGDYRGSMPLATASLPGTAWWLVGKDPAKSNSANYFTLARGGYAGLDQLRCANACESPVGRPAPGQMDWARFDDVSVSGQNLFSSYRPSMTDGSRMVVLADRSPLVLRAVRGGPITAQDPLANSPNHAGRGQNVLWTDGSSQWLATPVLANGDNVWLPLTLEVAIDRIRRAGANRGIVILRGMDDVEPGNSFLAP